MKRLITLSLMSIVGLTAMAADNKPNFKLNKNAYPEFSWDTVPLALHFSKRADFTPEEVKFIARFPIFCIEKHQGIFNHDKDARKGAAAATKAIKAVNPKAKLLFYWNSNIDGGTNYGNGPFLSEKNHPEWKLSSEDGTKDILVRGAQETFDSSNPDFRKWWVETAVAAVKAGNMDGAFIDALPHYFKDEKKRQKLMSEKRYNEIIDGVHAMTADLAKKLGENKILVFNNVNPAASRDFEAELTKNSDGGMIENFCNFYLKGPTKESALAQINQVAEAAKIGRVMMVKGWPRYSYRRNEEMAKVPREEALQHIREDIIFPMACFLMGAGKYSYFLYSWGYGDKFGSLMDFEEYHKPLGEPLGAYTRKGWQLSRKFKYADVWVDLENRKAKIDWKKKK